MSPRSRRLRRALVALLAAPVLLLLVAEWLAGRTERGNAVIFVKDPVMHIVRPANTEGYTWGGDRWFRCRINNVHQRGPDVPATKAPGETRVLCVGDSFTFGGGVEEERTWPLAMQALLGPPEQSGVRVMNAGANGWGPAWQRIYLESRGLPQTRPDVVVLGFNWNDVVEDDDAGPQAVRHFIHAEGSWLRHVAGWDWVRSTHLFRWLFTGRVIKVPPMTPEWRQQVLATYGAEMDRRLLDHERRVLAVRAGRADGRPPDARFWRMTDTDIWRETRAELERMRDACAGAGAAFVVALLPEPSWRGPGRFPSAPRLTSMLDEMGVPWVDLQLEFLEPRATGLPEGRNESLWLPADPVHPNTAGHAIFARRVVELLRGRDLLP